MNVTLLEQYNLNFVKTKDTLGNLELGVEGNGGLSEFLDDLLSSRLANKFLEKTSLYLEGGANPAGENNLSMDIFSAEIYGTSVDIRINLPRYNDPLQVLPLQDFHDILIIWRDFLFKNGF